jgi:hypothetical protein
MPADNEVSTIKIWIAWTLTIWTAFLRFFVSPSATLPLAASPSSETLRFRTLEVEGLDSTTLTAGTSSASSAIGDSLDPSRTSDFITFEGAVTTETLSASDCATFRIGTLEVELSLEPDVDNGPNDGIEALDKAAEMEAAGGRIFNFFAALDFGFFGSDLNE